MQFKPYYHNSLIIMIFLTLFSQSAFSEKMTSYQMIPKIVVANTAFALELYAEMGNHKKGNNLFFSPYSISTALAMTNAGARGNTARQISKVLHFPENQDYLHPAFGILQQEMSEAHKKSSVELRIANALWVKKDSSIKADFKNILKQYYGAQPRNVDFQTTDSEKVRLRINKWVENHTQKKIKNLLQKGTLNRMTRLVLVNAIYFKGQWANPFKTSNTKNRPFFITKTQSISVPMMKQKNYFNYMENNQLQVIELPYAIRGKQHQLTSTHLSDSISMVILLPKQRNGIAKLEKSLNPNTLEEWLTYTRPKKVEISLPKFKINAGIELSKILSKMGMSEAFTDKADFSGINGKKDLSLTSVIHQAFVNVDEQGTEAAAATAAVLGVRSINPPPPVFTADHPFIFLIRHKSTGSILFMGRLMNPIKN